MKEQTAFRLYLQKKGYSKTTITSYLQRLQRFVDWAKENKVEEVNTQYRDIIAYLDYLKARLQAHTIEMELSAVSHYFVFLQQMDIMKQNPIANINLQNTKTKSLHIILTSEQLSSLYQKYVITKHHDKRVPPQEWNAAARVRNKMLTGLLVFQGLSVTDIQSLLFKHISLRKGTISIPETRKYGARVLKLQPQQVFDMLGYLQDTRKQMLVLSKKDTDLLFFSTGNNNTLHNTIRKLLLHLKGILPGLNSLQQIRTSVIVHWLTKGNLREVQYKAGHKYISATEAYKVYCMDGLSKSIEKYHPLN